MRTIVFFAVIAVLAVAISARPSVQRNEKSMATDSPERNTIDSNKINKVAIPNGDKYGTNPEVKREKSGFLSHLRERLHTYRSHVADRAAMLSRKLAIEQAGTTDTRLLALGYQETLVKPSTNPLPSPLPQHNTSAKPQRKEGNKLPTTQRDLKLLHPSSSKSLRKKQYPSSSGSTKSKKPRPPSSIPNLSQKNQSKLHKKLEQKTSPKLSSKQRNQANKLAKSSSRKKLQQNNKSPHKQESQLSPKPSPSKSKQKSNFQQPNHLPSPSKQSKVRTPEVQGKKHLQQKKGPNKTIGNLRNPIQRA